MGEHHSNRPIQCKIFIRGCLFALTGLHIGGNSVGMAIGGADAVVVRNPLNNEPYIPGSSLRGKMRSLLERVRGQEGINKNPEGGYSVGRNGALAGKDASTVLGKLFGAVLVQTGRVKNQLLNGGNFALIFCFLNGLVSASPVPIQMAAVNHPAF
ncbi:MAG: hypothetical protein HC889_14490 [Synechococcaceae cyanobacterium SM1_2_3]|nr:hypothetical protein [Synechococcaceae cyanobacterium SM1_2_3]